MEWSGLEWSEARWREKLKVLAYFVFPRDHIIFLLFLQIPQPFPIQLKGGLLCGKGTNSGVVFWVELTSGRVKSNQIISRTGEIYYVEGNKMRMRIVWKQKRRVRIDLIWSEWRILLLTSLKFANATIIRNDTDIDDVHRFMFSFLLVILYFLLIFIFILWWSRYSGFERMEIRGNIILLGRSYKMKTVVLMLSRENDKSVSREIKWEQC